MNALQFLMSQAWVQQLGWTLVHFVWQGALIAAIYAVIRKLLSTSLSPQGRYVLGCAALTAIVIAPVVTFSFTGPAGSPVIPHAIVAEHLSPTTVPPDFSAAPFSIAEVRAWRDDLMPWLVMAWFAGVIIFWARLMGGWAVASRMRSILVHPAPAAWQRTLDELRVRICVSRPVRLLVSALVQVPTVVGWLRPVVLVPVGALAGLPAEHIEALLAHELAHIRRHDYLVNILQSVAEALLFYHPAVWWISNQIRNERELCCDDVGVAISGDTFTYVRALANLESHRPAHFNPALAANGGSLPDRIARLLGKSRNSSRSQPGAGAVAAAILIVSTAYGLFGQAVAAKPEFEAASIKPSGPFVPGNMRIRMTGGPGTDDPGRVIFEKYVLSDLLEIAYSIKHFQLSGPAWLMNPGVDSPRFDITAKIPEGATSEEYRLMLENLLAKRFNVLAHLEKKESPVYTLVSGKGASKLTPASGAPSPVPAGPPIAFTTDNDGFPVPPPGVGATTFNRNGDVRLQAVNMSMEKFAGLLSMQGNLGRPVTDATGLRGEYDFILRWSKGGTDAGDSYPTIFGAVQEQLGLKLESGKSQVEMLVVDRIEKVPTEN